MSLRRTIKTQARLALQGSWGQARLILLLLLFISFLINLLDAVVMGYLDYNFQYYGWDSFSYSSGFFLNPIATFFTVLIWIIRLILLAPLFVGMVGWYRQLTDRCRQGTTYIFWPFESTVWLRACALKFLVGLRLLVAGALLLVVPAFLLTQASYIAPFGSPLYLGLVVAGWVLAALGTVVLVVFSKRYCIANLLLCEPYSMTVRQAIRASVRGTRRHCFRLFVLDLSFLPELLPLLLLGSAWVASNTIFFDPFSLMPIVLGGAVALTAIFTLFHLQPYYTMTTLMYKRYLQELAACDKPVPVATPTPATDTNPDNAPDEQLSAQQEQANPELWPDTPQGVVWQDIED